MIHFGFINVSTECQNILKSFISKECNLFPKSDHYIDSVTLYCLGIELLSLKYRIHMLKFWLGHLLYQYKARYTSVLSTTSRFIYLLIKSLTKRCYFMSKYKFSKCFNLQFKYMRWEFVQKFYRTLAYSCPI
jgi:hypothetical protein